MEKNQHELSSKLFVFHQEKKKNNVWGFGFSNFVKWWVFTNTHDEVAGPWIEVSGLRQSLKRVNVCFSTFLGPNLR